MARRKKTNWIKLLKKIGKVLFGEDSKSSRSVRKSSRKTAKSVARRKSEPKRKPVPKKTVKKIKPKVSKPIKKAAKKSIKNKSAGKKTLRKRQPKIIKEALAILPVAEVTHYFSNVDVAVLKIKSGDIRVGDKIHFKGHTTNFTQEVLSMQINHKPVLIAQKGDDLGLKVKSRVRAGDLVTKL